MKLGEAPLGKLVAGLRDIFGDDLVGVYLHGSAALGCYGPHSDVDVVAAIARPSSPDERRRLAGLCLDVSQPTWDPDTHGLLELDVVVAPHLRPWRYPPPLDFHYSRSLHEAFERGAPKPWRVDAHADLASTLTIVHAAGVVLAGAPAAEVFPPVPREDYRRAIAADVPWCLEHVEDRRLYAVLSLPRIWAGMATEDVHSKVTAAEWALPRVPADLRPVLEHALAVYRGDADESWVGLPVDDYTEYVAEQIRAS